jgi:hypothetical protein
MANVRLMFVVLLCVSACADTTSPRTPDWASEYHPKPGVAEIEAPIALVKQAAQVIQEARNGSRLWFGTDVQVDAGKVRWRRCDEAGACSPETETAPLEDFLGVAAVPDSQMQQLRFREGSPTDKRLAFLASRGR